MDNVYNAHERQKESMLERVMGFEPTTFCLGSRYSTTELPPLKDGFIYPI